jgi:predicted RND superfamily exporter protein
MLALARLLARDAVAWIVVVATVVLAAVSVYFSTKVQTDDNVLAFLPQNQPEVRTFNEVSDRFKSLDVALVGVATDDVFEADFLGRLKSATKELNETDGIAYALSITSVDDYRKDAKKGGVETGHLVETVPETPEAMAALEERVMANENVVGQLVARDGKGVMIMCFLRHGADPHVGAAKVREIVSRAFPKEDKYWGGSPFISTYIYDITQRDLKRLAPWACVAIIALIILSFRDVVGMLVALASTAMGIVMTLGLMGALGVRSNIVLGSMPVILFALGSAPPVHLLTRYYFHAQTRDNASAIVEAMRDKGLVVVASAATVVAGLGSFVAMDIEPMRVFGLFTSIGIALTLLMAVVFVPAAIRVLRLKQSGVGRKAEGTPGLVARLTERMVHFARQQKLAVVLALGAVAAICAFGIEKVDTRMDNATFFDPGSEPDRADKFMRERFGGSQFVQIWVQGDMTDPYVVREVTRLGDTIAAIPNVDSVAHIGQVISAANDAVGEGVKAVPRTQERVRQLLPFVESNRAVSQLLAEDRRSALINVKLGVSDIDRVESTLANIENAVKGATVQAYVLADATGARRADVIARQDAYTLAHVVALLKPIDPAVDSRRDAMAKALRPEGGPKLDRDRMKAAALAFMRSDEFIGDMPETPRDAAALVADAVADLPIDPPNEALTAAVAKALDRAPTDEAVADVSDSLAKPLAFLQHKEARRGQADAVLSAAGVSPTDVIEGKVGDALNELELPKALLPAAAGEAPDGRMSAEVTGLPVLYRGLSRSVEKNQLFSLLSAVLLVAITMTIAFRSLASGVLSAIPALFTIVAVYGGMGLDRIHLDIGTSMLASLIIGAGVDYAIHFLGAWRAPSTGAASGRPEKEKQENEKENAKQKEPSASALDAAATNAAFVAGPGIWTNALMVAAGFFVLTLGEARPLKHVGTLTALAMVVASLATFLLVPVFARKHEYVRAAADGAALRAHAPPGGDLGARGAPGHAANEEPSAGDDAEASTTADQRSRESESSETS